MAWPAPPDGGHAHNPSLSNRARGPSARSRNTPGTRSMTLAVEVWRRSMMRADVNQPLCPNLTNQAPPGIQSEIQSHCLHCWSLLHSLAFDSCFLGLGYAVKWVDTIIHIIDRDWTRFSVTNEEMPRLKKTRRHWCAIKCTVLSLMMVEASPHSGSGHREPARAFAPPILHPPLPPCRAWYAMDV